MIFYRKAGRRWFILEYEKSQFLDWKKNKAFRTTLGGWGYNYLSERAGDTFIHNPKTIMRIALAGTHWSGKTTILNLLEGHKIKEQARALILELGNPKDMSDDERANFQQVLLTRQIRSELSMGDDFISDRSVYDILAYSEGCSNADDIVKQVFFYLSKNPYDLIFYFPIEFEMEKDGTRPEDEEYRKKIDSLIFTEMINNGEPLIPITGTIEERLEKILSEIRKYEAKNRKKTQIV